MSIVSPECKMRCSMPAAGAARKNRLKRLFRDPVDFISGHGSPFSTHKTFQRMRRPGERRPVPLARHLLPLFGIVKKILLLAQRVRILPVEENKCASFSLNFHHSTMKCLGRPRPAYDTFYLVPSNLWVQGLVRLMVCSRCTFTGYPTDQYQS